MLFRSLVSYETVVQLIGRTQTSSGLSVKAILDTRHYETGLTVTAKQMDALLQELVWSQHEPCPRRRPSASNR